MKIVVAEPHLMSGPIKDALNALGDVQYGPFDDTEFNEVLSDCDALIVRLGRFIDAELIARAPRLRFLVTATTGLDHVDLAATSAAGIRVISLRDCADAISDVSATAELTLGLLLALVRYIPPAAVHTKEGGWQRDLFWGRQLRGKQLGIIGCGRIGAMVTNYAAALGMEVLAYDRILERVVEPARPVDLGTLLDECDAVSVHVTASPENSNFMDGNVLARMKDEAFLVNTSRGFIVDEAAVADAIRAGHLSGVAVDVLKGEQQGTSPSSPLLDCAREGYNVIITPHIGGATREAIARAENAVVNALIIACSASPVGPTA